MKNNPKYFELCLCATEMDIKQETYKYTKDNKEGMEVEEYEIVCPNCGRCRQVKIEKREVK